MRYPSKQFWLEKEHRLIGNELMGNKDVVSEGEKSIDKNESLPDPESPEALSDNARKEASEAEEHIVGSRKDVLAQIDTAIQNYTTLAKENPGTVNDTVSVLTGLRNRLEKGDGENMSASEEMSDMVMLPEFSTAVADEMAAAYDLPKEQQEKFKKLVESPDTLRILGEVGQSVIGGEKMPKGDAEFREWMQKKVKDAPEGAKKNVQEMMDMFEKSDGKEAGDVSTKNNVSDAFEKFFEYLEAFFEKLGFIKETEEKNEADEKKDVRGDATLAETLSTSLLKDKPMKAKELRASVTPLREQTETHLADAKKDHTDAKSHVDAVEQQLRELDDNKEGAPENAQKQKAELEASLEKAKERERETEKRVEELTTLSEKIEEGMRKIPEDGEASLKPREVFGDVLDGIPMIKVEQPSPVSKAKTSTTLKGSVDIGQLVKKLESADTETK